MSIVLKGLALDVDSTSSIVAYGLSVDPADEGAALDAITGATIEQLYVVDYGGQKRRPTPAEYRRWKRITKGIGRDNLYFKQRKGRKPGQVRTEWYVKQLPRIKQA